jgi:hypothetical protein
MRVRVAAALGAAGTAGALGAVLLAGCAVLPAERSVQEQRALAERRAAKAAPLRRIAHDESAGTLARFYGFFPPAEALTAELERVHRLAATAGLQVGRGAYRLEARDNALGAFRISLPVRGRYPQVRAFLGKVLEEMPVASLDSLRFERKKAGDARLDVHVELAVYFRPAAEQP